MERKGKYKRLIQEECKVQGAFGGVRGARKIQDRSRGAKRSSRRCLTWSIISSTETRAAGLSSAGMQSASNSQRRRHDSIS